MSMPPRPAEPPRAVEPNEMFLDGNTPTIVWDRKVWPIPELAPAQNRHVAPALFAMLPIINGVRHGDFSPEQYDKLADITYWALKCAHPLLRREFFDLRPYKWDLMMANAKIIGPQTGIMKTQAQVDAEKAAKEGEPGGGTPNPVTT